MAAMLICVASAHQPLRVTDEELQEAQNNLLEAKALYSLRNTIVDDVLKTNPVLNAVHAGSNASTLER